MLYFAVGLVGGMLSLFLLENSLQAYLVITLCVLFYFLLSHFRRHVNLSKGLLLGMIWSSINLIVYFEYSTSLIMQPKNAILEGVICSIPENSNSSLKFDFCVASIDSQLVPLIVRSKVKVSWYRYSEELGSSIKAGQTWRLSTRIKPIHGKLNPAGFDYERWLLTEGFAATASVNKTPQLVTAKANTLLSFYHQQRQLIYDRFVSLLPRQGNDSLLLAILMGERANISAEQWQKFQQSGTSHLLAISGLHVGIAAMWCYWITLLICKSSAKLCQLLPAHTLAEVASLLGAVALVLLSGLGLPAQRALIMLIVFLVSRWSGRQYSIAKIIGSSAVIILILQPFAVLAVSFWLSFIAVSVIAVVINRETITKSKVVSWFKINWYLYLLLIPTSWFFFAMVSWVSLFANLILIPYYSFVLTPLLYVGAIATLLNESLASVLFHLSNFILELSLFAQEQFSDWNSKFESYQLDRNFIPALLPLFLLLLLPKKLLSRAVVFPVGLIVVMLAYNNPKSTNRLDMWIFDVGHGLSIYVETQQGNMLFDTAWGNANNATLTSSVLPYLDRHQIKLIDKVIISHADADHAGGLQVLSEHIEIGNLLSGEPLDKIASQDCHHYPDWHWSGIQFQFIAHKEAALVTGNNASCVLEINANGHKMLLTGDIEKAAEKRLLAKIQGDYHLLIAPHHGSMTSSTPAFVNIIRPKHVVFSAGYANQWRFPRSEVIQRYRDVESKIWTTFESGALKVEIDSNGQFSIESLRQQNSKFWYPKAEKD